MYAIVSIIAAVFFLIAGLYRPLRRRMANNSKHFKPLAFYPLFIGAIGTVLAIPALIHIFSIPNVSPLFVLAYLTAGVISGLLLGGLYVLGYEGKAPFKIEALLILPLLATDVCMLATYIVNS